MSRAKMWSVLSKSTREKRRFRRGVYLLPSVFTVANMFCGWASIVFAMRADYMTAAPFIGFAMVLDVLDGRIARLTGATSDFGEQFDSLADVVSFGVAPAVLVFAWGLEPLGSIGWAVGFLWLSATAVRLARFNIQAQAPDKRYFLGLPSPPAAGVPAATVFFFPQGPQDIGGVLAALLIVIVPAALMVSRLRYRSFNALLPGHRRSSLTPLVIAAVIAAIAAQPQAVLMVMSYTYLCSGPIGSFLSNRSARRAARSKFEPIPIDERPRPASRNAS